MFDEKYKSRIYTELIRRGYTVETGYRGMHITDGKDGEIIHIEDQVLDRFGDLIDDLNKGMMITRLSWKDKYLSYELGTEDDKKHIFVHTPEGTTNWDFNVEDIIDTHDWISFWEFDRIKDKEEPEVFTLANIKCCSIGTVVNHITKGRRARRTTWDYNEFIYYIPANGYSAATEIASKYCSALDNIVPYAAYIAFRDKSGLVHPWNPTTDDVLATDWEVLGE